MPYDIEDKKKYPGLYSLRGLLRNRPMARTLLPTPADNQVANINKALPPTQRLPEQQTAGLSKLPLQSTGRESWGGKKFAGDVTTDRFVSLAGALSQAIAPETAMGRVGGVMSQFGQQEQRRRLGKEERLREEGVERENLYLKSLFGLGKEEREYEGKKEAAETLRTHQLGMAKTKREHALALAKLPGKTAGSTALARLGFQQEEKTRKRAAEKFEKQADSILHGVKKQVQDLGVPQFDKAGKRLTTMPPIIEQIMLDARVIAQDNPDAGIKFLKERVREYQRLLKMTPEQRQLERKN